MLDAGGHQRAMLMMKSLNESVAESIEPRPMLSVLARLGSTVERDPELLLLRSGIHRQVGRVDESIADIDRAVERSYAAAPPGAATRGDRVGPRPLGRGQDRARRADHPHRR